MTCVLARGGPVPIRSSHLSRVHGPILHEKGIIFQKSYNQVYYTACSLLVLSKNSCSKLHYQKGFKLIPFSYEITPHQQGIAAGSIGVRQVMRLVRQAANERRGNNVDGFTDFCTENGTSQGQNLVLNGLFGPRSLDKVYSVIYDSGSVPE